MAIHAFPLTWDYGNALAGEWTMTANVFFASLLVVWIVFYIAAPIWLVMRGRWLSGGSVQLFGALLPGIWQGIFWPDEGGNFGLPMMTLVLMPICVIFTGLAIYLYHASCWMLRHISARRGS